MTLVQFGFLGRYVCVHIGNAFLKILNLFGFLVVVTYSERATRSYLASFAAKSLYTLRKDTSLFFFCFWTP